MEKVCRGWLKNRTEQQSSLTIQCNWIKIFTDTNSMLRKCRGRRLRETNQLLICTDTTCTCLHQSVHQVKEQQYLLCTAVCPPCPDYQQHCCAQQHMYLCWNVLIQQYQAMMHRHGNCQRRQRQPASQQAAQPSAPSFPTLCAMHAWTTAGFRHHTQRNC